MSLSSLPREVVLDIADRLNDVGVNALVCTNSGVYNFLNEHLYRRDLIRPQSRSVTWAAELGVEGAVQHAVYAGRHFNPVPESLHIGLQVAVDEGHVHLVELLLGVENINLNFRGGLLESEGTPLGLAAKRGHSAIVDLLLAADDVDPNLGDELSLTPLYWACKMGHVSIVRQLLARGDVSFGTIRCGQRFTTPLTVACMGSHVEVINLLLAKDGIDINFHGDLHGETPLMMAINRYLVEVVKSLLERDDLKPNIAKQQGFFLFFYYC